MRKKLLAITLSLAMLISAIATTGVLSVSAENAIFTVAEDFEDINVTGTEGAFNAIGCTYPFGKALYFGRGANSANATITFDKAGTADDAAVAFWFDTNGSGYGGAANMSFVPMTSQGVEMCIGTAYTYYTVIDGVVAEAHPTGNFTIALPADSTGWVIMPLPAEGTWHKGGSGKYYGTCEDFAALYLEYIYFTDASMIIDQISFVKDVDAFKTLVAGDVEDIPGYTDAGHVWDKGVCTGCDADLYTAAQDFASATDGSYVNGVAGDCVSDFGKAVTFSYNAELGNGTASANFQHITFDKVGTATDEAMVFYYDNTTSGKNAVLCFAPVTAAGAGTTIKTGHPVTTIINGELTEDNTSIITGNFTMTLPANSSGWVMLQIGRNGTGAWSLWGGASVNSGVAGIAGFAMRTNSTTSVVLDQFGFVKSMDAFAAYASDNANVPGYTGKHTWVAATCATPKTCSVCGVTEGEPTGIHNYVGNDCFVCGKTIYDVAEDFNDASVKLETESGSYELVNGVSPYGQALKFGRTDAEAAVTVTLDGAGTADHKALVFYYDNTMSGYSGDTKLNFIPRTSTGRGITLGTAYTYYTVIDGEVATASPDSNMRLVMPRNTKGWVILPLPASGTWDNGGTGAYYGTTQDIKNIYLYYQYYNNASIVVDQFGFAADIDLFKTEAAKGPDAFKGYGASIGSTHFDTLADAIAAAQDGDTVVLQGDVAVDADDRMDLKDGYKTFFKVAGKTITIDLNGKTVTADASAVTDNFVVGVFSAVDGGNLTITGDGAVKGYSGATMAEAQLNPAKGNTDYNYKFYSLLASYGDDAKITVNGGDYELDYAGDALAYTSSNEGIVVNGGSFRLGNLGGIRNGMPWVFNAKGQNTRHVLVNGGSFCADIQHQYYPFEVLVPKTLALKKGDDGMYTIVPAVAYVTEREWSSAWYTNEVGYATLEEAYAACEDSKTIAGKTSEPEEVVILDTAELQPIKFTGFVLKGATSAGYSLTKAVAQIGDTCYATLEEAIKAVPKDTATTIVLLQDYVIKSTMVGHQYVQNITVDLNGHLLSSTGIALTAYRAGSVLTIKNGTVKGNSSSGTLRATYGGHIVLGDALTIEGAGGGATLVYVDNGSVEIAAKSGVQCVGGKVDFKQSANENNKLTVGASIGRTYYATLADALAAAQEGDTIALQSDVAVDADDLVELKDGYKTFFKVDGKSITVDLNGKTVAADASAVTDSFVVGVFATVNGAQLTINGDGAVKGYSGATMEEAWLNPAKGNTDYNYKFYCLLSSYDDDAKIVVNGGNYELDFAGDSMAYSSGNEGVIVNGGSFKLGNLGGIRNGMPWVFNARGQNIRHVVVNGGSFCSDIHHQYYPFEVLVPKTLALKKGDDGMYTVVPAVAYVTEREWSSAWYTNEVGYATLEEAIAACEGPKTKGKKTSEQEVIVLLDNVTLDVNTTITLTKTAVIDLNGKTIYGENNRTSTHNFLIDVKGGTLTAYNGTIAMKHTGANMGWNGATTVIDVTAGGVLNLNGVTVQNLGGTDMNFAVHMNNWGEVTLNADNCVFDAPYCGVRVFNSGYDMNNVKITNSKLTGATRAFWVHNYLGDLDSNKHSDEAIKARLALDIYGNNNVFETTGTAKSPIRYGFSDAKYFDVKTGYQIVDNAEDLQDAIDNGTGEIILGGDIDLSGGIIIP